MYLSGVMAFLFSWVPFPSDTPLEPDHANGDVSSAIDQNVLSSDCACDLFDSFSFITKLSLGQTSPKVALRRAMSLM